MSSLEGASSSDPQTVEGGEGVPFTSILASRMVVGRLINDLTLAKVPAEDINAFRSYVGDLRLPSGSSVLSAYDATMQDVHNYAKTMINAMRAAEGGKCPSEEVAGGVPKRQKIDAIHAADAVTVDPPGALAPPHFLDHQPPDVVLYTPELLKLYKRAGEALDAVSALGAELVSHEGSFLEVTDAQFEAAVPTELAASMDASAGARLLHKLALSRSAVAALRDTTTRVKRIFWLANHTRGCNWSTLAQLKFREEHDANAVVSDPHFTPLATWEDQVSRSQFAASARSGSQWGRRRRRWRQRRTQRRAEGGWLFPRRTCRLSGGGGAYGPPGSPYGAWWYRGGGGGGRGGKHRRPHNRNKENAAPCLNNGGKGGTPA